MAVEAHRVYRAQDPVGEVSHAHGILRIAYCRAGEPLEPGGRIVLRAGFLVESVQDVLERRIAVENPSYYLSLSNELDEATFITAVLAEADCDLLLDVNNIYVNSVNHGYDAEAFLAAMPGERIAYYHVAGHFNEAPDLIVDTHGAPVIDPVWDLLGKAYARFGVRPTLLERDTNIPPLAELLGELAQIRSLQRDHAAAPSRHAHAV